MTISNNCSWFGSIPWLDLYLIEENHWISSSDEGAREFLKPFPRVGFKLSSFVDVEGSIGKQGWISLPNDYTVSWPNFPWHHCQPKLIIVIPIFCLPFWHITIRYPCIFKVIFKREEISIKLMGWWRGCIRKQGWIGHNQTAILCIDPILCIITFWPSSKSSSLHFLRHDLHITGMWHSPIQASHIPSFHGDIGFIPFGWSMNKIMMQCSNNIEITKYTYKK